MEQAGWREVASEVERLAGLGVDPGERGWEAIRAILSVPGPEEAVEALSDPGNPGHGCAWELVLYPDMAFRERLEPVLARAGLGDGDAGRVAGRLSGLPLLVRLVLPGGGERVLPAPAGAVEALARRLNLGARIPRELSLALDGLGEETGRRCRVLARDAGGLSAPAAAFLARMAERMGGEQGFPERFELALHVLRGGRADPVRALGEYAAWCGEALSRAEADDAGLAGMNLETRLALGHRPAYVDRGRMEARLAGCRGILAVMAPEMFPLPGQGSGGPAACREVSTEGIREWIREGLEE